MHKRAVVAMLVGSMAYAETKPTVVASAVEVTVGTFDTVPATKVVKSAQARVLACYKTALAAGPGLGTMATAKLKLAVDGKVSSATVTGLTSSDTAPVHNCIADVLSKLKFAAPKGGAVVDLAASFVFTRGDGAGVYGGTFGSELGDLEGGFGLGRQGVGPGGGGTGWGTIGTGRYGTIGQGSGFGYGARGTSPTITVGQAITKGDLDKAIIRRYIKRNIQKLQYCYEHELLASPKLEGTVRAEFTIAATGMVSSSTASGLANANVERCVAGVIKNIEFPKPPGGDVVVSYPFTFKLPVAPPKKK